MTFGHYQFAVGLDWPHRSEKKPPKTSLLCSITSALNHPVTWILMFWEGEKNADWHENITLIQQLNSSLRRFTDRKKQSCLSKSSSSLGLYTFSVKSWFFSFFPFFFFFSQTAFYHRTCETIVMWGMWAESLCHWALINLASSQWTTPNICSWGTFGLA